MYANMQWYNNYMLDKLNKACEEKHIFVCGYCLNRAWIVLFYLSNIPRRSLQGYTQPDGKTKI